MVVKSVHGCPRLYMYMVIEGCTMLFMVVQCCTRLSMVVQYCTRLYNIVHSCIMLYKSVHDYKRLYMVVHCTWLYMIVQSCKLLSKSMYIVYKVVHGCASFFIIVQGCISLYKFVHHCSMLYKVVHGCKGWVDQNCFLQHLNSTINTRDSKRGNRHWEVGTNTEGGEDKKKLVLIYSLSRPKLLFTASKSDFKHQRF